MATTISLKLKVNPIIEIPLRPLGLDAKMAIHLLNRDMTNFIVILVNHVYDKYSPLQDGELVIDCGAYIGEFTIQAARRVGATGLVLAFEPNPRSFSLCKANIERNGIHNVKLFPFALGEKEGSSNFETNEANLGASKVVMSKGTDSGSHADIKTLSEFLPYFGDRRVKLLKMDVEGYATRIVLGSDSLFRRQLVRNVCAEVHPGEEGLKALLENYGFRCFREDNYLYAAL